MGDMLKSSGFWWTILFSVFANIYYFIKFSRKRDEEYADKMLYSCIATTILIAIQFIISILFFQMVTPWWLIPIWVPYLIMLKSRIAVKREAKRMDERREMRKWLGNTRKSTRN